MAGGRGSSAPRGQREKATCTGGSGAGVTGLLPGLAHGTGWTRALKHGIVREA